MLETLTALLAAHVLADFLLQFRWIIRHKQRIQAFGLHILIVGVTAALALGAFGPGSSHAVLAVVIATAAHAVIDAAKIRLAATDCVGNARHGELSLFLGDQAAHILTLALIAMLLPAAWHQGFWASTSPHLESSLLVGLCLIAGFILTTRAGGFAIAYFMQGFLQPTDQEPVAQPETEGNDPGLPDGGAWIGLLERTLIFMLVLMSHFAAIGFLIAAKSILRFQYAKERSHSEIVIIGTLASFTWAILIAWLTTQAIHHFT